MKENLSGVKALTGAAIANVIAMFSLESLDIWIKIISTLAAAFAAGFAAYNYYQSGRLKRIQADKIEDGESINSSE